MKKGERRVLKKGRIVITRKGSFVLKLANSIVNEIKPYCRRIEIVGSIRRKEKNPVDVDIVLIPKDKEKIKQILIKKGKIIENGEKQFAVKIKGVKVELYFVSSDYWGAALFAYTGSSGYSIGLRIKAKKKGLKLNQYGLFKGNKKIAGKTEKEIYKSLGKNFKLPEERI
ncbi:MAG: hypothetical protein PHH54_02465 [Candidatus Nanoarchaeia archaeon]|nr:hypothetical protein [Candidatus Nanoarchaeia archaeon]MDD5740825.1 hypothetical protein [Candidatus Nanoarchaeia archaeon]